MPIESTLSFTPHPFLRGGHLQTLAAAYWWKPQPYQARQHQVELTDGDAIVLHEDSPAEWHATGTLAMLVHGLAGCHQSGYMQRIAAKLCAAGVRVFRMDMRGCGAGWRLARGTLNAGRSADVGQAVEYLLGLAPQSSLVVVGFSLGASIVLKWLTESPTAQIARAIAVAPPIDLLQCSQRLRRGCNRLYDHAFSRALNRYVAQRRHVIDGLAALMPRSAPRSLFEFDDRITAPLGGYPDAETYYRQASVRSQLGHIRVPTHILTAADDPLIPSQLYEGLELPPSVHLAITPAGGHLGFLASTPCTRQYGDADWHWMDWRIVDWTLAVG